MKDPQEKDPNSVTETQNRVIRLSGEIAELLEQHQGTTNECYVAMDVARLLFDISTKKSGGRETC